VLVLRAWLDEEDRNARRIAELIHEKAHAGHFSYVLLLLDLVDGKIRPTAEEEWPFEPDCVLVMADDARQVEFARAA
jgi:hypothetical protein